VQRTHGYPSVLLHNGRQWTRAILPIQVYTLPKSEARSSPGRCPKQASLTNNIIPFGPCQRIVCFLLLLYDCFVYELAFQCQIHSLPYSQTFCQVMQPLDALCNSMFINWRFEFIPVIKIIQLYFSRFGNFLGTSLLRRATTSSLHLKC
jgi:hypothetical protein